MQAERSQCVIAIIVALWFGPAVTLRAEEPLPSIDVIRTEYLKTIRAPKSMDLKYRGNTSSLKGSLPDTVFREFEFRIFRDGDRQGSEEIRWTESRKISGRSIWAFDGTKNVLLSESQREGIKDPPRATIRAGGSAAALGLSINVICGWGESPLTARVPPSQERMLVVGKPMIRRWEEVDGQPCVVLECEREMLNKVNPDRFVRHTAWVDPTRGYLGRKYFSQYGRITNDVEQVTSSAEHVVLDFTFVVPEQAENGFWFPTKGRIRSGSVVQEYELVEAAFNEPLDPQRFQVEIPPDAQITEYGADGQVIRKPK